MTLTSLALAANGVLPSDVASKPDWGLICYPGNQANDETVCARAKRSVEAVKVLLPLEGGGQVLAEVLLERVTRMKDLREALNEAARSLAGKDMAVRAQFEIMRADGRREDVTQFTTPQAIQEATAVFVWEERLVEPTASNFKAKDLWHDWQLACRNLLFSSCCSARQRFSDLTDLVF